MLALNRKPLCNKVPETRQYLGGTISTLTSREPMPHTGFQDGHIPVAYLITFRSYGTWLHGREGSVDRFHNTYGRPKLAGDERRRQYSRSLLARRPVILSSLQRAAIEKAIRETCRLRNWRLWASNIRTKPRAHCCNCQRQTGSCSCCVKSKPTREMREAGCWRNEQTPWVDRGSRKFLWTEEQLNRAIAYVLYDQGEPL
jgi:hypothetical protein